MEKYRVFIKPSAVKDIEQIKSKKDRRRIVSRIRELADNAQPPGCEKLSGRAEQCRLRQGSYRILYSVDDEDLSIHVVKVARRKDVYR